MPVRKFWRRQNNVRHSGLWGTNQSPLVSTNSAQRQGNSADQLEGSHGKQRRRREAEGVAGTNGNFGRDGSRVLGDRDIDVRHLISRQDLPGPVQRNNWREAYPTAWGSAGPDFAAHKVRIGRCWKSSHCGRLPRPQKHRVAGPEGPPQLDAAQNELEKHVNDEAGVDRCSSLLSAAPRRRDPPHRRRISVVADRLAGMPGHGTSGEKAWLAVSLMNRRFGPARPTPAHDSVQLMDIPSSHSAWQISSRACRNRRSRPPPRQVSARRERIPPPRFRRNEGSPRRSGGAPHGPPGCIS